MIIIYFFASVILTFLTTFVLDAYMNRGEIFDFIRIAVGQWLAKKNGVDFDIKEMDNFDNYESPQYFGRMEAYELKYWEIAFYTKLMNPFICKTCMSVYMGFFYSAIFTVLLEFSFAQSIGWFFIQNLCVFFLIELKSNNE